MSNPNVPNLSKFYLSKFDFSWTKFRFYRCNYTIGHVNRSCLNRGKNWIVHILLKIFLISKKIISLINQCLDSRQVTRIDLKKCSLPRIVSSTGTIPTALCTTGRPRSPRMAPVRRWEANSATFCETRQKNMAWTRVTLKGLINCINADDPTEIQK